LFRSAIIFAILLASHGSTTYALDPGKGLAQYEYEVWQAREGLPHGILKNITQTSDRYIWISTEFGLIRFDGVRFKTFSSKNVEHMNYWGVGPLCATPQGTLWFGDSNNLLKIEKDTVSLSGYNFPADIRPQHTVTDILQDKSGALWVSHAGAGLFRIRNSRVTRFGVDHGLPAEFIHAIEEDKEGNVWIATNKGAGLFKDEKFIPFAKIGEHEAPNVEKLFVLDDKIWLRVNGRLFQYESAKFQLWEMQKQLPVVIAMCQDKDKNLWLGTDSGLFRYKDGRLENTQTHNLLPDSSISALFEDIEGNLWVGTRRGGLAVIRDPKLTSISVTEGLPNDFINAIHEDKEGRIWIGTRDGLVSMSNGKITQFPLKPGMDTNIKSILQDRDGRLWVGTSGRGLHYLQNSRWRSIGEKIEGLRNIITICQTEDGRLWFGSSDERKLFCLQGGEIIDAGQNRSDLYTQVLLADGENLWVGARGGFYYVSNGAISNVFEGIKLPEITVRSLYKDHEGSLWIGTSSQGLYRIKDEKVLNYTEEDGLYDKGITQIEEDMNGNLWLGSRSGIYSIRKADLDAFDNGRISRIPYSTYETGIRDWKCMSDAHYTGREGPLSKIYFPTNRGVMIIDTKKTHPDSLPPVVHIEEVIANNKRVYVGSDAVIPPGRGEIEIHYTGLSFTAPEQVRFRYKLEGYDKDWVEADTRRVAFYTKLQPGSYSLEVQAISADGVWSKESAHYRFQIRPHFYQTYIFYTLCLLLLIAILWLLYLWRLRQIRSRFRLILEERLRIARELHDTLSQGMAGVAMQLNAATSKFNRSPEVSFDHVQLARQMVQYNQEEIRHCIMDLRSAKLEGGNLVDSLSTMAEGNLKGNVSLNVLGTPYNLPKVIEHNILRIAQEAITNAQTHGKASLVEIKLSFEDEKLDLEVKDNGPGFDLENVSIGQGHFGITGMKERAERIGAMLKIESKVESGTSVRLVFRK
jgi:ligand-binding sensor domain-containing protein/signal transduction histidine kinase